MVIYNSTVLEEASTVYNSIMCFYVGLKYLFYIILTFISIDASRLD